MKKGKIIIAGVEHPLCFTTRVLRDCAERYGDISKIGERLTASNQAEALEESIWLLAKLMDGGARYARLNGEDCPPALTLDDLMDGTDISDLAQLKGTIMQTISDSNAVTVKTESKNAETTRGEA